VPPSSETRKQYILGKFHWYGFQQLHLANALIFIKSYRNHYELPTSPHAVAECHFNSISADTVLLVGEKGHVNITVPIQGIMVHVENLHGTDPFFVVQGTNYKLISTYNEIVRMINSSGSHCTTKRVSPKCSYQQCVTSSLSYVYN